MNILSLLFSLAFNVSDVVNTGRYVRKHILGRVSSEDSDQSAHSRSLIRFLTGARIQSFFMRITKTLIRLRGCAV